jgi:predicted phosphohydrolase
MRVFAIADPHLSRAQPKPMTIFGPEWEGHPEAFFGGWREVVRDDDLVLVPGDLSWALRLEDALVDLGDIAELPGRKVILRGNHDYWWPSVSKLRAVLPAGMRAVQNDALVEDGVIVAGSRGWICPGTHGYSEQDEKIYRRELERLRLSLASARKLTGEAFVVMMHFPPVNSRLEPSGFTELLLEAAPDALVFGHVHGEPADRVVPDLPGIDVHFVAADALGFRPRLVLDTATFDAAAPDGGAPGDGPPSTGAPDGAP